MKQVLILLLLVPVLVWADSDANINARTHQLESALARIQQEAQSTYQQFLMIQELRRSEMREMDMPVSTPPSGSVQSIPVPNYDDLVKLRQEKQERIQKYTTDLDRLYNRYQELEERRQVLFDEIDLLKQSSTE
ncbi:MAG: hypothetical protein Q8K59_04040 [Nitrosomonas sp.]|nr:hypothetical protein [Nitrosomonas sp.]MDP1950259.1 hypothetical protein [Nitrosomonas sp.]